MKTGYPRWLLCLQKKIGRGIFFCRGRDQADTGWSSCSLVREQLKTCYFIMKGWLNIIFWCERFIITLKKRFFVWILWSLLHCFAIDGQRKRKLWIRSDLERDTERPVCLMLFFYACVTTEDTDVKLGKFAISDSRSKLHWNTWYWKCLNWPVLYM